MPTRVERRTVNLSGYPDLVVIYLGMRVRRLRGVATVFGLGPKIKSSWQAEPDGLLLHEDMIWSLFPLHVGMLQYWRDFAALDGHSPNPAHSNRVQEDHGRFAPTEFSRLFDALSRHRGGQGLIGKDAPHQAGDFGRVVGRRVKGGGASNLGQSA